jgi:signal peptidase II
LDKRKKLIIFLSLVFLGLFADLGSKIWANKNIKSTFYSRNTQKSFSMKLNLAFNKGSAFSLGSGIKAWRWIGTIIGIGAIFFVIYLYKRPEAESMVFLVGLALVLGGALGNMMERAYHGVVTDFLQVWLTPKIKITWPWPTFNIADILLLAGVGLMFIHSFKEDDKKKSKTPSKGNGKKKSKTPSKKLQKKSKSVEKKG